MNNLDFGVKIDLWTGYFVSESDDKYWKSVKMAYQIYSKSGMLNVYSNTTEENMMDYARHIVNCVRDEKTFMNKEDLDSMTKAISNVYDETRMVDFSSENCMDEYYSLLKQTEGIFEDTNKMHSKIIQYCEENKDLYYRCLDGRDFLIKNDDIENFTVGKNCKDSILFGIYNVIEKSSDKDLTEDEDCRNAYVVYRRDGNKLTAICVKIDYKDKCLMYPIRDIRLEKMDSLEKELFVKKRSLFIFSTSKKPTIEEKNELGFFRRIFRRKKHEIS